MSVLSINRSLDFKNEILIWKDVVKKSPKKLVAHNNLAIALLNKDMIEEGEKHLKIALKLDPTFKPAYLNLGHIYFKRKNYLVAEKYFELSIFYGAESGNGLSFYNAGLTQVRMNKPLKGISYFKKAIAKSPNNSDFHYALGNAYKAVNRKDAAIKEYKKTLNLDPKNSSSQNNIGVIFFENKMYHLAEKAFLKTLLIDKNHAETYNNLATVYAKNGNYKLAIKNLRHYLTLKPLDSEKTKVLKNLEKLSAPAHE